MKGENVEGRNKDDAGPSKHQLPDVIVIEDDDDNSEVENQGVDGSGKSSETHYYSSSSGYSLGNSSFDTSDSSDSSDEEDCVVIECRGSVPPASKKRFARAKEGRRPPSVEVFEPRKKRSRPCDSSDCEIILDFDGKIQRNWEEAALRRRMMNARQRARSEESTSASNHVKSDRDRISKGKQTDDGRSDVGRNGVPTTAQQCEPRVSSAERVSGFVERQREESGDLEQQDSNVDVCATGSGDTTEEDASERDHMDHDTPSFDNMRPLNPRVIGSNLVDSLDRLGDTYVVAHVEPKQTEADVAPGGIVIDRESLKRTREFLNADEEEWARRHMELQKQAEEAQRERKRRKLEAQRRLDMEARQQRRLEEIRMSQLKEERTSGLKEQVRGRVQAELEHLAATCRDMGTLLRRLGVPLDGGPSPTAEQVNAAYKKALLRFHPDRASASAKADLTHQVEAEEKFKLVSRMKGTLPLVSGSYF